jgi:hypothetical protein
MHLCHLYSKNEPSEVYSPASFREFTSSLHHLTVTMSLLKVLLFLSCPFGTGNYHLPNIVRLAEHHLACIAPTRITWAILPPNGRICDWHQTVFSPIIPFGHDFASLDTGAVVSRKLTTPGLESIPPSTVLGNSGGECWSFRGNAGTFGVVLDTANVMPSHIAIHHRLFNSTTSLSRAPRQVTVWGMVDGDQNMKTYSSSRRVFTSTLSRVPPLSISKRGVFLPLANIDFDITAPSLHQTFPLSSEVQSWGIDFGVIVLDIHSKWGGDVTSLCSVHIYGQRFELDM